MDDMYLNVFQYAQFTDDPAVHELARQAIEPKTDRWPAGDGVKGVVPYTFADPVDSGYKKKIEDAIEDFNNLMSGCLKIRFVHICNSFLKNVTYLNLEILLNRKKRSSDTYYTRIITQGENRCSSTVGLPNGVRNDLNLHYSRCEE